LGHPKGNVTELEEGVPSGKALEILEAQGLDAKFFIISKDWHPVN